GAEVAAAQVLLRAVHDLAGAFVLHDADVLQADAGDAHSLGVVLLPVDLVVVVPIGGLTDVAVRLGAPRQKAPHPLRVARPSPILSRGDGRIAFGGLLHDLAGGI